MLLLGEQDFAASGHNSFDAKNLVMVALRQATSTSPHKPRSKLIERHRTVAGM